MKSWIQVPAFCAPIANALDTSKRATRALFRSVVVLILCAVFASSLPAGTFEVDSPAELKLLKRKQRAAQFLQRATFGPTEEAIDELSARMLQVGVRRACSEWIDRQFELPTTLHIDTINAMLADHGISNTDENTYLERYRYHAFYHNAIRAEDQLQQRVAWALSQIFVISDLTGAFGGRDTNLEGTPHWYSCSSYYDHLLRAVTGNYRDLLGDVTLHPVMGSFLSHLRNAKADPTNNYYPDENYAREVMQLFSIGLYELHTDGRLKEDNDGNLIPTYDNETIKSMARVFTGLTFHSSENFYWTDTLDYVRPMQMWEDYHDTGAKELLNGVTLPAHNGEIGKGMEDVNAALDHLADHPNVGPFLARRLIQLLVHSNPSRAYIRRVAAAFDGRTSGVRGDMKSVIKAILLDREAWVGIRGRRFTSPLRYELKVRGTTYSKLQEPVLRYTAMIRAFGEAAYYDEQPSSWYVVDRMHWQMGQSPFGAPSVFNFYLPDYQPPGPLADAVPSRRNPYVDLYSPEFMMLTPIMNNRSANHFRYHIYNAHANFGHWGPNDNPHTSRIDFDYEQMMQWINSDRDALMDHLNLLFCAGTLADESRDKILQSVQEVETLHSGMPDWEKLTAVIYTVMMSPSCLVVE